jgi:hypothetical protein
VSAIEMLIDPRTAKVGNGSVQRVLPFRKRRMIGPFIFADLIGPETLAAGTGVDVDAHPHIGLSTLTYLFAGRMVHCDSTGAVANATGSNRPRPTGASNDSRRCRATTTRGFRCRPDRQRIDSSRMRFLLAAQLQIGHVARS